MEGVPWTYDPPDNDLYGGFSLYFGAPGLTNVAWAMNSQYLGPAPGTVGIDQANLMDQSTGAIPHGCHVPAFLSGVYATSQLVDVSIQPGGGSCSDPDDGTLGVVNWQQTTVSDYGQISTSAAIVAQFIQSNGLGLWPPGPYGANSVGVWAVGSVYNQSACVLQRIAPQHARCRSIGADRSRNRQRHVVAFGSIWARDVSNHSAGRSHCGWYLSGSGSWR